MASTSSPGKNQIQMIVHLTGEILRHDSGRTVFNDNRRAGNRIAGTKPFSLMELGGVAPAVEPHRLDRERLYPATARCLCVCRAECGLGRRDDDLQVKVH